ncbi:GDSL-type esterase/lipase family protein [Niabella sp. CC-SYL272]|uniref:SGNH/GDSL hydrolase family protein n=1 Tax=Niabella agricola TaxID=2891571 RepID=UPI001F436989|nr:GDSL-type esterase/lipase family protein [Niabella agricola]MCF3110633.1 GDSL-type esterase/lipase family protein [Niabella agricola]
MNKMLNIQIMMICLVLMVPLGLLPQEGKPNQASPITLMGLGDSITEGGAKTSSYLFSLWKKLKEAGYNVNFIGPRQTTLKDITLNHSGFGGQNAEFLEKRIDSIYREFPADVVLLHSGHNYFVEDKPISVIIEAQKSIISKIKAINPGAAIFVAQVIESGKLPKYSYIPELNKKIKSLVDDLQKTWSGVYLVGRLLHSIGDMIQ